MSAIPGGGERHSSSQSRSATPVWWCRACLLLAALGAGYCASEHISAGPAQVPGTPAAGFVVTLLTVVFMWPLVFSLIWIRKERAYSGNPTTAHWDAFVDMVRAAWRGAWRDRAEESGELENSTLPWVSAIAAGLLAATFPLASPLFCPKPALFPWALTMGFLVGAGVLSFQKARASLHSEWLARDRTQLFPHWISWSRKHYDARGFVWAMGHHVSTTLIVVWWLWGGVNLICR